MFQLILMSFPDVNMIKNLTLLKTLSFPLMFFIDSKYLVSSYKINKNGLIEKFCES